MTKTIKFLIIAILISINLLAVNAQETTVAVANEVLTEKVEKKETIKKQASSDDSWTGFYVGGFGGYTNNRSIASLSTTSGSHIANSTALEALANDGTQKISSNGFNGGGTFGYNYQKGKFFIGGETDFSGHRINKSISETTPFNPAFPASPNNNKTIAQAVKSDWLFTARPRIGVAFNKSVIYATGGIAVTNIKYSGSFSDTIVGLTKESSDFSKTKTGTSVGAGVEFKVASKWSIKAEYLFTQFGRISTTSTNLTVGDVGFGGTPVPSQVFTHSTDLKLHSVRFGINHRF